MKNVQDTKSINFISKDFVTILNNKLPKSKQSKV